MENYLTSLVSEIGFDLQNMSFLGCPCYWPLRRMNLAPVLGRCQEPGRFIEPAYFLDLVSRPARLFFKPNHI